MRMFLIAAAVFLAAPAAAQLYVCKSNGKTSYSSEALPGSDCRLQQSYERVNQQPAAGVSVKPVKPAAATPVKPSKPVKAVTPKNTPVVSARAQKIRDKKRGQILLYELKKEIRRQEITSEQLAQTRHEDPENAILLTHLQKQLHIHTQNITAIRQEIARL